MPKSKESDKKKNEPNYEVGSGNIFADFGFPHDQAVNLQARAELMITIRRHLKEKGWSQRKAGTLLDIPQPRIAEMMKLKIDKFSVDQLLKYLDRLGLTVSFVIKSKEDVA